MLFNSFEFIFLFLPFTLFAFFQLGKWGYYRAAIAWLIAASLFFYGWGNISYLGLLIVSIAFNYFVGLALSRRYRAIVFNQKGLLAFGVLVNLGLLGYFKYSNFFLSTTNDILGTSFNLQTIILPLAISFYTFNQIAYLVDAYHKKANEYNFLNYCLFIIFFPHLIAGPIVHHKEMISQFEQESIYRLNHENLAVGLAIFCIGIFKKVVIADEVATYAQAAFASAAQEGASLTFFEAWAGAIHYSFQLYFDFSGYSDMAIGLALMFNIKFPLNFDSPYKAVNIIEFWRRWHITLSNLLRDYIYIPLGGNRKGKLRRYLNLMITMLLGGLWHGAGWTFVVWGGLHGIYLVINHQWHVFRRGLGHDLTKTSWWSRGLGCLVTFLAVVVAWVFFRAENMGTALRMLEAMVGVNGVSFEVSMEIGKRMLVLLPIIVWFTPNTQQWMEQYNPTLEQRVTKPSSTESNRLWKTLQPQPNVAFGIILGILTFISLQTLIAAPPSEFLYFNF
jgi:D-alanyl-lipoteichoic acid acyltransferase DltB (MBOAT superfamily)